jgi:hypothetical protein
MGMKGFNPTNPDWVLLFSELDNTATKSPNRFTIGLPEVPLSPIPNFQRILCANLKNYGLATERYGRTV